MKGWIYRFRFQGKEAMQIGERVYKESQEIEDLYLTIDALLLRGQHLDDALEFKLDDVLEYVVEAEKILNEIADVSSLDYIRRKASILLSKAQIYFEQASHNKALECALRCLEIQEKVGRKIDIAYTLQTISLITMHMGDRNAGLEYAMKSLALQEELNNRVGIAASLSIAGSASNFKGYVNQAIEFSKKYL